MGSQTSPTTPPFTVTSPLTAAPSAKRKRRLLPTLDADKANALCIRFNMDTCTIIPCPNGRKDVCMVCLKAEHGSSRFRETGVLGAGDEKGRVHSDSTAYSPSHSLQGKGEVSITCPSPSRHKPPFSLRPCLSEPDGASIAISEMLFDSKTEVRYPNRVCWMSYAFCRIAMLLRSPP